MITKQELTDDDIHSIKYFHFEKDDVTRWCDWNLKKEAIREKFPALFYSLENYKGAKATLDAVVKGLSL